MQTSNAQIKGVALSKVWRVKTEIILFNILICPECQKLLLIKKNWVKHTELYRYIDSPTKEFISYKIYLNYLQEITKMTTACTKMIKSMQKKLRYQFIISSGIDDQRILQFDWLKSLNGYTQPQMPPSLNDYFLHP